MIHSEVFAKTADRNTNALWGLHVTGLQLASDAGARLTAIALSNTWGGGGTAMPADNYYRFKDFYVSGGYARAGERPDHWVLTLAPGGSSTPSAGTSVELVAQLVDGNNNPVDVFGQSLQPSLHVTGSGTLTRHADPAGNPYVAENHGRVLIRVNVASGAASGQDIAVSLDDYAKQNNGSVNGFHRSSNTLHLTVR